MEKIELKLISDFQKLLHEAKIFRYRRKNEKLKNDPCYY